MIVHLTIYISLVDEGNSLIESMEHTVASGNEEANKIYFARSAGLYY